MVSAREPRTTSPKAAIKKLPTKTMSKICCIGLPLALSVTWINAAYAQDSSEFFQIISPQDKNQLWINPGMVSHHFQQEKGYNNGNWGLGAEYRFNTVASVTAGRFYNSDRTYSNYAGVYYQPIALGPIKIGAVVGGFNGYPQTNHGGWFAAALPALTWEGDYLGANLFVIPTVGDRVHGAISLQLKLKVWE